MKRLFLIVLAALVATAGFAQSSDSTVSPPKVSVAFAPQYLIMDAIRIDIEFPLVQRKREHRLTLSPYLYAGTTSQYETGSLPSGGRNEEDFDKTRVSGFGLEVVNKYMLPRYNRDSSRFYVAFGAGYHRIKLDYPGYAPVSFVEDGIQLFEFDFVEEQERINRLDVLVMIGLKALSPSKIVMLELFAGPVLRKSWINASGNAPKNHEYVIDHGYDGVAFRLGASLGIYLF